MYSKTKAATHSGSRSVGDKDVHQIRKCPIKAPSREGISQPHADHLGVHLWVSGKVHDLYLEPRCHAALDPLWALATETGTGTAVAAPTTAATAPALGAHALETTVTTVATETIASAFPVWP